MTNDINNKQTIGITTIQQGLLEIFIIVSPIYKCVDAITIFGLNPITIVIGLIFLTFVFNIFHVVNSRQNIFGSIAILLIFCFELFAAKESSSIGWILAILLYVFFLQTDKEVSIEKLYRAFLISSIVAAFFSLTLGFVGGTILRTATSVDGSIAPIAITIILFCDNRSFRKDSGTWDILKIISFISSFIVLIFGMSRARILIVAGIFAVFVLFKFREVIRNGGRITQKSLLIFIASLFVGIILLISGTAQKLFAPILNRLFNEGLSSMGRDVEIEFGLQMFRENVFVGGGWGTFTLRDLNGSIVPYDNHCAYIAVLARGGILFAVPTFISYLTLLVYSMKVRRYSSVALVLMLVFLLLSYGNAGMFNYTVCSIIPLVVLDIKRSLR